MLQASEGWLTEATPFSCALFAQRAEDDEPELRRGRDGTMFVMGLSRKGQAPQKRREPLWGSASSSSRFRSSFLFRWSMAIRGLLHRSFIWLIALLMGAVVVAKADTPATQPTTAPAAT